MSVCKRIADFFLYGVRNFAEPLSGGQETKVRRKLSACRPFLAAHYAKDHVTTSEIDSIIRKLDAFSALDLYESNKQIMKILAGGFKLRRESRAGKKTQKDLTFI